MQVTESKTGTGLLARLKHWSGIDRAIGFTILGRGWSSMAGVVNVFLIARFLSPFEQGYYYTFGSLVAIQIVFELGFSFVIQQMASHECAHLAITAGGQICGEARYRQRLASVLQTTVRWYSCAAALFLLGLLPSGLVFFGMHSHSGPAAGWQIPWICVAIAATLTFQIDPLFAFLEGCGFVPLVARSRMQQAIAGSLLAWTGLLLHHGLYAPALMIFGQALVGTATLWQQRDLLGLLLRTQVGEHKIVWMREVWPFQWRIAVSWTCGYFIFQLFNPILFAFHGAQAAGQMGMSLSIGTAVANVGISWISTKSAPFGAMIAKRDFVQLDRVFFRALKQSWTVCLVGCVALFIGALWCKHMNFSIAQRLLDPVAFAFLLGTIVVNHVVFAEAIYLRAHKQEKFLFNSITVALLMAPSTYYFGRYYGATGMMAGYFVINALVGLCAGTYIFIHCRRSWHGA